MLFSQNQVSDCYALILEENYFCKHRQMQQTYTWSTTYLETKYTFQM